MFAKYTMEKFMVQVPIPRSSLTCKSSKTCIDIQKLELMHVKEMSRLHESQRKDKELIQLLTKRHDNFKKYACHLDNCDIVTNARSGRIIKSECTCGFDYIEEN